MATATVGCRNHSHSDSLPLIDLRLLTQSELLSLSHCSSRASRITASHEDEEDEVSTPKIDRSVFNESAGSRKQTFSRLRLAPRSSLQTSPQIPNAATRAETLDEDYPRITSLLESLFNIQSHSSSTMENDQQLVPIQTHYEGYVNNVNMNVDEGLYDVPISVVTYSSAIKRKRGRPRKDDMIHSSNWWLYKSKNKVNPLSESSPNTDNVDVVASETVSETGKRKRGRPRKGEDRNNKITLNMVSESSPTIVTDNVDVVAFEMGKRKRGRPKIRVNGVIGSSPNVGKRGRGRPRKNESVRGDKYVNQKSLAGESEDDLVSEAVNRDGVAVDLAALENMEDPFGEELRRRTEGIEKKEELLDFLTGLKGEWVSLRKKRKIVDASEFGDALPKGWKIMLCIKKKVGHVWLGCRRYISPNGRQFMSCKEVSSYLLLLSGVKDAKKPSSAHTGDCIQLDNEMTFGNAVNLTLKDDKYGTELVFRSPFPSTSLSTGQEKETTVPKIMSPGEVRRQENVITQSSISNLTIDFGYEQFINKQERHEDSEAGLFNLFGSEKIFGFDRKNSKDSTEKIVAHKIEEVGSSSEHAYGIKNNYMVDKATDQESRLEDTDTSTKNELMTDSSNNNRSGMNFMTELLLRADDENILLSGLANSSRLNQSPGCFPAFGTMSDKGVSELFNEKYDSISGFEEVKTCSIGQMEYNFLTTQPCRHSEESKALKYDGEMSQGFDSSVWLQKGALPLLPKVGSGHRVRTVCAWCRNEFHHEPVHAGGETGSVGFMCPTCKSKFSGSCN